MRLAPAPGAPRRFNFYKDLAGETRKFAAWVKALAPGALTHITSPIARDLGNELPRSARHARLVVGGPRRARAARLAFACDGVLL